MFRAYRTFPLSGARGPGSGRERLEDGGHVISPERPEEPAGPETPRRAIHLEPYRADWPAGDPDGGLRSLVAEYSRLDPLPTLEVLGRNKSIPVGALAAFVLGRACCAGLPVMRDTAPLVVVQMGERVREAETAGTDEARLAAYRALAAIVSWLKVPLADPAWRPGPSGRWLGAGAGATRPGAGPVPGSGPRPSRRRSAT